jgi:hypothetical protein
MKNDNKATLTITIKVDSQLNAEISFNEENIQSSEVYKMLLYDAKRKLDKYTQNIHVKHIHEWSEEKDVYNNTYVQCKICNKVMVTKEQPTPCEGVPPCGGIPPLAYTPLSTINQ